MRGVYGLLALAAQVRAIPTLFDLDPAGISSSLIDTLQDVVSAEQPQPNPLLEVEHSYFDHTAGRHRKRCVLHPVTEGFDDENFKKAFEECGDGGIIRLPGANYTINSPLTTNLNNAVLSVSGWISFSADIDHWVKHRVPIDFQDLALAWIITGSNYVLDGHGTGGIYGNGQVWYSWAKQEGNKYGRPMSFAIVNSTNVTVQNWSVVQPQFWATIVVSSENVLYKNYYVNATNYDPAAEGRRNPWIQNTDGADTYRSHNVTFDGMIYQGGDDCIALKPNSSMITARNVTCYGGTGIAFGSIAQYPDRVDWLVDIDMQDMKLLPSRQMDIENGIYFKSWIGYVIGTPPNGGGGGLGYTKNVRVKDVVIEKAIRPVFLQTALTYLLDRQGEGRDTGKFEWNDIVLSNITGTSRDNRVVWIDCAKSQPCHDIHFEDFHVKPGKGEHKELHYVCNNVVLGGKDGLDRCHPDDSKLEPWR